MPVASPEPFFDAVVNDGAASDLQNRLRSTRWPGGNRSDFELLVSDLVAYWANGFDFGKYLDRLKALPAVMVEVDVLPVFTLWAKGDSPSSIPLLLTHGWPDSDWRYRKVLPLLTGPDQSGLCFDVVAPCMPGFGWTPPAPQTLNSRQVAALWAQLMTRLGYEKFIVAGGDIGSHVARYLALDFPDRVIGVHRMDAGLPYFAGPINELTTSEQDWFSDSSRWVAAEGAYGAIQSTKPETLAVGLADSPAGLATWLVDKLQSWSDCGGDLLSVYSIDDVLDLLSDYWFTNSIGPSVKMYRANAQIPKDQLARFVETPSGFSIFKGDITHPPIQWLRRTSNLAYATEPPRGGHFAPHEVPQIYAQEIRNFVSSLSDTRR